ncbi:Hint domain-containing protein [Tropicimonas sp. S265A]|uniref:Hint domain-containing protein n=1 Tax=Tropicimonas sp. S265A TaxID=3415134 RepID=UPI003C797860
MARISELHYSNAYAANSGVAEFAEVALAPSEDPADFVIGFYNADGSLILEVALDDPGVQVTFDAAANENVYTISSSNFGFVLTDPDGGSAGNAEATALTNIDTGTVVNFYDIGGGTQNITATQGAAAGAVSTNLAVPTGPQAATYSLQFNQPNPTTLVAVPITQGNSGVICFVAGTLIETPTGLRPVEDLRPGQGVCTRDSGPQPVRWVGRRRVRADAAFAPIVIAQGQFGADRDTAVSPQHRVLVTGWQAEMLFGSAEVLVPAAALVNGDTVYRRPGGWVTYCHVLFDTHQIIRADGTWSESFHPGPCGLDTLAPEIRAELLALFPEAEVPSALARPALRLTEGAVLAKALRT